MHTACCKREHCFHCRTSGWHAGRTCAEAAAARAAAGARDEIARCPACGVHIVKGDGCGAIACVCGARFDWDAMLREQRAAVARALVARHGGCVATAAAAAARASLAPAGATPDLLAQSESFGVGFAGAARL